MKKNITIAALVIFIVFIAWFFMFQQKKSAQTTEPINTVTYYCDGNKNITAAFYEGTSTPAADPNQPPILTGKAVLTLANSNTITLGQTISADGVRYANKDDSFVFWSKGNGAIVLENNKEINYVNCIAVAPIDSAGIFSRVYVNSREGFSLRLPSATSTYGDFTVDQTYKNQLSPKKIISGIKFTIPASLANGTNLSKDSYLSVESIPNAESCTADMFFDGVHNAQEQTLNDVTYSVATSQNAGAGNRYEETVYAIPGLHACTGVRYMIHYSVLQNYPDGTVEEFDKPALLNLFDQVRQTLLINQ